MPAYGYEFYLLVVNSISHLFAALTREISSWPLEDKIHIHARACNILYISCFLKYEKNIIAFSCHKHILSTVYFWEIIELIDFSTFGKIRCLSSLSLMGRGEIYLSVLDWTVFIEFRADLSLCLGPDPFRLNIVVESSLLNRERQRGRH